MQAQTFSTFTKLEHQTWSRLFAGLDRSRRTKAHPLFVEGLDALEINGLHIPDLDVINAKLRKLTGWQGVPVCGLEDNKSFFAGLARKQFPIGNFIRQEKDLSYTPAPDVFHDLYGHLPFLADRRYARFCQSFGEIASRYSNIPDYLEQFGRLFWFGVEFPLIKHLGELRIFGGGILSSVSECDYALSDRPIVSPFNIEEIRRRRFYIDDLQVQLYALDHPDHLYDCLGEFEAGLKQLHPEDEISVNHHQTKPPIENDAITGSEVCS